MGCCQSTSLSSKSLIVRRSNDQATSRFRTLEARALEGFEDADKDNSGSVSVSEVKRLLKQLNVKAPTRVVKATFVKHDKDGNGTLDLAEFKELFRELQSRPNVEALYKKYATKPDIGLTAANLLNFYNESCGTSGRDSTLNLERCQALINKYAPRGSTHALNLFGFTDLLSDGNQNSFGDKSKLELVYQDMSKPLSHYFISSSHNTYLSGNQLRSASSTDAIARALQLGVRVIELDAWDPPASSKGDMPIVNHGHTLCKPVSFKDCIKTICEHGHTASQYPVIITIENHCSVPFQKIQAKVLREVLGKKLFIPTKKQLDAKEFLSPASLKGKVVIRDKPKRKGVKSAKTDEEIAAAGDEVDDDEDSDQDSQNSDVVNGVAKELLELMYILNVKLKKAKTGDGFEEPQHPSSSSMVESKAAKYTQPGPAASAIVRYSQTHLLRVYPAGLRFDSSNYGANGYTQFWNAGCQLVALNYQTNSPSVWLNQGKFSDNGGSGYVLKPKPMLKARTNWDLTDCKPVQVLKIRVISGHYLPKPQGSGSNSEIIDPFVKVTVSDAGKEKRECTTNVVKDNGFDPVWDKETFEYSISQPELALVSFLVMDSDTVGRDDYIAQMTLPLHCIRPGYRMVPLRTVDSNAMQDSFLFCHVALDAAS